MQAPPRELEREPLVANQRSLGWISDGHRRRHRRQNAAVVVDLLRPSALCMMTVCFSMIPLPDVHGRGRLGQQHPVMWGWAIINFVWWIGIGHAGTLISAILFLLRQKWRTSINRAAEAMTDFRRHVRRAFSRSFTSGASGLAGGCSPFPIHHGIWPQFRSPLMWDVFAVSTYFTVSVLFWYMGLIPDLAVMRDRAKTKIRKFGYGLFALGWTGSNRHWSNYEKAYLILAGLSTPLVLSVIPSCPWTSPCRNCPAGIRRFSRLTSWPARFIPASAWC